MFGELLLFPTDKWALEMTKLLPDIETAQQFISASHWSIPAVYAMLDELILPLASSLQTSFWAALGMSEWAVFHLIARYQRAFLGTWHSSGMHIYI